MEESHFDSNPVRERTGSGHLKGISVLRRTQTSRAVIPCFESFVANSGCAEESFRHQPGSRACRQRLFEGIQRSPKDTRCLVLVFRASSTSQLTEDMSRRAISTATWFATVQIAVLWRSLVLSGELERLVQSFRVFSSRSQQRMQQGELFRHRPGSRAAVSLRGASR